MKESSRQRPRSAMSWKTLEKSRLEPAAPNRLADRKRCALSAQPNPHLRRFGWVDKAQRFRSARRFGAAGSSPDFSRVFHDMALPGLCLERSFDVLYCRTQANPPTLNLLHGLSKSPRTSRELKEASERHCLSNPKTILKLMQLPWTSSLVFDKDVLPPEVALQV